MLTVYFKIGLYVDCQCVRWRHLALVTEKLIARLHLSKLRNQIAILAVFLHMHAY